MKEKANAVYWFVGGLSRILSKIWFRIEFIGRENIPEEGGCIIACNHVSFLDPPLVGSAIASVRVVRFIARANLRSNRMVTWLYDKLLSIPIDRDKGDLKAMRLVLNFLKNGSAVGLFPEGSRSPDGTLQEAKGGIGFLICKAKVPVVPAYIEGSYEALSKNAKIPRPRKIRIYFGEPVSADEFATLGSGKELYPVAAKHVMKKIAALADR